MVTYEENKYAYAAAAREDRLQESRFVPFCCNTGRFFQEKTVLLFVTFLEFP